MVYQSLTGNHRCEGKVHSILIAKDDSDFKTSKSFLEKYPPKLITFCSWTLFGDFPSTDSFTASASPAICCWLHGTLFKMTMTSWPLLAASCVERSFPTITKACCRSISSNRSGVLYFRWSWRKAWSSLSSFANASAAVIAATPRYSHGHLTVKKRAGAQRLEWARYPQLRLIEWRI